LPKRGFFSLAISRLTISGVLRERFLQVREKMLSDSVKKLIEKRRDAHLATLMPDGSPQVTQTWVDHEGDLVIINTFEGSRKHRNVERNPRVALDVCDPSDPGQVAMIRGIVREVTFEGAEEHVDKMAKKYMGLEKYPMRRPGIRRVLIKIEPKRVSTMWDRRTWIHSSAPC
jgi:PPOX class probable F420-dependent enzyme